MSNVISLKLEVLDYFGSVVTAYVKNVESDYTPSADMVFAGEDYTLTSKNIYFDLDDGRIFVRFVEYLQKDEPKTAWDFLTKQNWNKLPS